MHMGTGELWCDRCTALVEEVLMLKSVLIASLVIALGAACGSAQHGSAAATPPAAKPDRCPMHVAGTEVAASDTESGAALTFTTTGDVGELRARAHEMARMHDDMAVGGHEMGMMKDMPMTMPPAHASAEDIDGGARVTLTPIDPAKLDALRSAAHHHVDMMRGGDCPMMRRMGGAPPAER